MVVPSPPLSAGTSTSPSPRTPSATSTDDPPVDATPPPTSDSTSTSTSTPAVAPASTAAKAPPSPPPPSPPPKDVPPKDVRPGDELPPPGRLYPDHPPVTPVHSRPGSPQLPALPHPRAAKSQASSSSDDDDDTSSVIHDLFEKSHRASIAGPPAAAAASSSAASPSPPLHHQHHPPRSSSLRPEPRQPSPSPPLSQPSHPPLPARPVDADADAAAKTAAATPTPTSPRLLEKPLPRPVPAPKPANSTAPAAATATAVTATAVTATTVAMDPRLPPPDEDLPFDFHRFLSQLRHRSADPVAKFLRSFLHEFAKKQWMVHEQVKIVRDFLTFIYARMDLCDVWREVGDGEMDNAMEGMEKLVMNRLYTQTFSPEIPLPPPSAPRLATAQAAQSDARFPGRRGQHQEDVERDAVLAQKVRIYSWIREEHLDIGPTISSGDSTRRFLDLAVKELLKMGSYRAPRDKVICVLNCCKVIFGLLRHSKSDESADKFVPILIFVVLRANPDHLVSNLQYILRFRNPAKLTGEAGYYLSSLVGVLLSALLLC